MTRPQFIRADTIDLQDHHSPSAQDHTKQPTHPAALGAGPPAPHQAETLRDIAAEAEEEQHRSPRVSTDWNNDVDGHGLHYGNNMSSSSAPNSLTGVNLHQQDALAIAQNGGLTGAEDAEMADAEGDDCLDDDMMDKISSSPSIDDGGYFIPQTWPERFDSLSPAVTPCSSPHLNQDWSGGSSSPFVETPEHYPLHALAQQTNKGMLESEDLYLLPYHECIGSEGYSISDASPMYDDEGRDTPGPLLNNMMANVVESYNDDPEACYADELFVVQSDFDLGNSSLEDDFDHEIMTFPYESSEEEDDDVPYPEDSRFIDSGWGGECLQESEDIDFDLVYALHTFVATVEGQANATKGDTMVLLDDSNSYWWLVRVVKDSSIGYLPAEHIETPTERLARLNKHRNIDLSATMLGDKDQNERSKNPLKLAIRRRNTKTVTFSAPTYVEASDIDYSTDDEEADGEYFGQEQQQGLSQRVEPEDDEITMVETQATSAVEPRDLEADSTDSGGRGADEKASKSSSEVTRTSDEIFDGNVDGVGKSRNGTVRVTDSFFKDESVETRKITLTPNLLRDDSSTSTRASNDSKEARQRPSLDKPEKDVVPERSKDDKRKKERKEKDKKPGMLSNLFKRKDKKGRVQEEDTDELIYGNKVSSEDTGTSPEPSRDSEGVASEEQLQSSPQRHPNKLQKQPRVEALTAKQTNSASEAPTAKQTSSASETKSVDPQQPPAPERAPPAASADEPSMRLVQPESQYHTDLVQNGREASPEVTRASSAVQSDKDDQNSGGTSSAILRSKSGSDSRPRTEEATRAKVRTELDDFNNSTATSPIDERTKESVQPATQRSSAPGTYPDSYNATSVEENPDLMNERLSESPVQISPVEGSRSNPPALMVDTSSQEEGPSPASSPSPELVDVDDIHGKKSSENSISTPTSTSTWSDAHLRTYFDDDTDIKDLLVVVYDKSGVIPAGSDHPIMGNLFKEENAKLADITNRLDGILGDWLLRKVKLSASR